METTAKRRAHFGWGPFIITIILTAMVAWSLYKSFLDVIPEPNQRIVDMMLGYIMAAWNVALAYWFGTTFGSASKNEIIAHKSGPAEANK